MKGITAAEEFKNNPDLKEEDLKHIKEWMSKQDHMPKDVPDETLILLLHSCYYSLEATKQTIDQYFTLRTHIPEFFSKRDPEGSDVKQSLDTSYMLPLKGRTPGGHRVIVCGLKKPEPSQYHFAEQMKTFNMILDSWQWEEGSADGFLIVLNMEGMSLGHLPRLNLTIMKRILMYLQEGMPVRLKGFHYINVVPFVDTFMGLMKPFMKKELIEMLTFHNDGMESVFKIIPKNMLPDIVGGSGGSLESMEAETWRILRGGKDYMKEEEKLRIDETRRPGKAKNPGDIFGMEGSFRKLNLD